MLQNGELLSVTSCMFLYTLRSGSIDLAVHNIALYLEFALSIQSFVSITWKLLPKFFALLCICYQYWCNMIFSDCRCRHCLSAGMCCLAQPMWRTLVVPLSSCSRQLYTSLSVICQYSWPRILTHQSAKHLTNFNRRPADNIVRSLLRAGSFSTAASCELSGLLQRDFCNSCLPSAAPQRVFLKTSPTLNNLFCYNKAKTVDQQNPVSFQQSRHYIPRQLTSSTKTIVDASPLSLQPYLRLIRFDRPIGTVVFVSCFFN